MTCYLPYYFFENEKCLTASQLRNKMQNLFPDYNIHCSDENIRPSNVFSIFITGHHMDIGRANNLKITHMICGNHFVSVG